MKISIIGGGIGGLTLGNFLKQQNIDFKIYESAPEIKTVGAGIAMAGNAMQIFDKLGRAFEPDFLLFCKQRNGEQMTFQVFIEPKGEHLKGHDKWKEDFLKEIRTEQKTIKIHTDTYLITAGPFYNYNNENEFKTTLENTLNE